MSFPISGFFVPFTYLPDMAITFGMSRDQAAFLVSIIGIANTVARVACGWVSDRPWADCLLINNCALVIGGVMTMLCPFCLTYPLLGTYSFVFGSCIGKSDNDDGNDMMMIMMIMMMTMVTEFPWAGGRIYVFICVSIYSATTKRCV